MSALTDTGRSEALETPKLNDRYRPEADIRKPRREGGAISLIEIRLFLLGLAYAAEVVETNPIDIVARYIQFAIGVDGEYPDDFIKEMSPVAFIRNVVLSLYYFKRFALSNLDVVVCRNSEMSYPGII